MRQFKSVTAGEQDSNKRPNREIGQRLQRKVDAFSPHVRPAISMLCTQSSAMTDLADSFPALLFALATDFGSLRARREARRAIEGGKSLRDAAGAIGLPIWLRKLPPQAFLTPFGRLPSEPGTVARLVSLIPAQAGMTAAWLDRVLVAYHTGRPELAVWTAQHYRGPGPAATSEGFLRVLAWAWHGGQPGLRAADLLTQRWTPNIGVRRAASEAALWRERIALDLMLGPGISDSWLADGSGNGYEFVGLRTADDFIAEARVMDNCLDRYSGRLSGGAVRIFSIRRNGLPVADVEIAVHERELGMPAVTQLRAPRNRRASLEIWQATYAWLGGQALKLGTPELQIKVGRAERRRRLEKLWRPFLTALPEHARAAFEPTVMPVGAASPASRLRELTPARTTRSPRSPRSSRPDSGPDFESNSGRVGGAAAATSRG